MINYLVCVEMSANMDLFLRFVQALCQVLQRYGRSRDLVSNLTRVSRKVAFDFQSNTPGDFVMHEKKQIPCVTSMLTRDIYFPCKV